MRKEKGEYGYRDSSRRMRIGITSILVAAILAQVGARFLVREQAAKNILTVMAILTVLPMANMASPLLASWRYRTPPEAFHQKMMAYEGKCVLLYDLILTTKEFVLPMDAIAVHPGGVYAYCTAGRVDLAKAEKSLNDLFSASHLEPCVKVFGEERSFLKRLDSLKAAEKPEGDGVLAYETGVLKSMSM
ncbi:MAG: O-linked GlcNAc transferase-like protein [Lachnospiraceae bacterium]|jgi:hypothetical protein|nr:O-linked GlcNAc transferase-like protein [Lachnospiraceae bacterium]